MVTKSQGRQLLHISYIGRVRLDDFTRERESLAAQLAELSPGYRLLTDFSAMEGMDADCLPELGRTMELISAAVLGLVVRVIPDPSKDVGLNILGAFHYVEHPKVVTCENLVEAGRALGL